MRASLAISGQSVLECGQHMSTWLEFWAVSVAKPIRINETTDTQIFSNQLCLSAKFSV